MNRTLIRISCEISGFGNGDGFWQMGIIAINFRAELLVSSVKNNRRSSDDHQNALVHLRNMRTTDNKIPPYSFSFFSRLSLDMVSDEESDDVVVCDSEDFDDDDDEDEAVDE